MMLIRKAKLSDLKALGGLLKELNEYTSAFNKGFLRKLSSKDQDYSKVLKRDLKYWIKARNHFFQVVEINGKLIGFMDSETGKFSKGFKTKKIGIIGDVFIKPKYRGKGLGSNLSEQAFKWFKKNKIKFVKLWVKPLNKKAIKLYKKQGFKLQTVTMFKKLN